jgi:lysophospholipase L1-like esterase
VSHARNPPPGGRQRASLRVWGCVAALTVALGAPAGAAHADVAPPPADACAVQAQTNHLVADATNSGVISLYFHNAAGARVLYWECIGQRLVRLGARKSVPPAPTILENALTWSCDRLERRFVAAARMADGSIALGTYSVRTPSCRRRFKLDVPSHVVPGKIARIRIVDLWGIGGISPKLCVTPAQASRKCETIALRGAVALATRRYRARTRGRWHVELRVNDRSLRDSWEVGGNAGSPKKAPIRVLATGDSMMQGVDSFLSDELGDTAEVHSDVLPGSQISRGDFWAKHSAAQTKRLRQDITVISTGGASDGLPLPDASGALQSCCDEPWLQQYTRRLRRMMRTYLRAGRARVFWLTLPAPRYPPRKLIADAVNTSILRAADGLDGVSVVRLDLLISPDGYRENIRYRGRDIDVREPDGVHLNISGTAIAAKAIKRAIRGQ